MSLTPSETTDYELVTIMRTLGGTLGLLVLGAGGCGGSASLVLKIPVSDQCAKAALQGCDEIAEGVLLYVEGKKSEGTMKLKAGAAQNSPEKIRKFADLLKALSQAPGAGKYALMINEVVITLTTSEANAADTDQGAAGNFGSRDAPASSSRPKTQGVLTADTDAAQIRSDLARSPTHSPAWCTQLFGEGTTCVMLSRGPLFFTDSAPSAVECHGQFLAVLEGGRIKAQLESPLRIHGAKVFVSSNSALVLGQRSQPDSQATSPDDETGRIVLDEVSPAWSCSLFWSGFVPYDVSASQGQQPPRGWTQESGF